MSMIETINDVSNSFLSRREITCNFRGLGGKLKKTDAVEMVTKEFKLDGKTVIAINLQNHTGRPNILGTFYIYDDENLAKKQVSPVIFERLEKIIKNTFIYYNIIAYYSLKIPYFLYNQYQHQLLNNYY